MKEQQVLFCTQHAISLSLSLSARRVGKLTVLDFYAFFECFSLGGLWFRQSDGIFLCRWFSVISVAATTNKQAKKKLRLCINRVWLVLAWLYCKLLIACVSVELKQCATLLIIVSTITIIQYNFVIFAWGAIRCSSFIHTFRSHTPFLFNLVFCVYAAASAWCESQQEKEKCARKIQPNRNYGSYFKHVACTFLRLIKRVHCITINLIRKKIKCAFRWPKPWHFGYL